MWSELSVQPATQTLVERSRKNTRKFKNELKTLIVQTSEFVGVFSCNECERPGYYPNTAQNTCEECPKNNGFILGAGLVLGSLVLAPLLIKFAGLAKHAGSLTGPVISLVNFLQSVRLYIFHSSLFTFEPADQSDIL